MGKKDIGEVDGQGEWVVKEMKLWSITTSFLLQQCMDEGPIYATEKTEGQFRTY